MRSFSHVDGQRQRLAARLSHFLGRLLGGFDIRVEACDADSRQSQPAAHLANEKAAGSRESSDFAG
jgi:hypothetical protein